MTILWHSFTQPTKKAALHKVLAEGDAGRLEALARPGGSKGKIEFARFNQQDRRAKGVSGNLVRGDSDTREASGHTSEKLIAIVYDDRRPVKWATPAD